MRLVVFAGTLRLRTLALVRHLHWLLCGRILCSTLSRVHWSFVIGGWVLPCLGLAIICSGLVALAPSGGEGQKRKQCG